jgi:hypothetical protein
VDLGWTDNSNNEDNFIIERCTGATCMNFAQIGTATANSTTFRDNSVVRRNTYRYRVKARNGFADSGYSNIASATPR